MNIAFDWLSGHGIEGADAFTWASVSITVDGELLTAIDTNLRTVRSDFATSLLPIAEWIVDSWPRLVEERRLADPVAPYEWLGGHCLRAGRGGGPMPDIRVSRRDEESFDVVVRADRRPLPGISLEFVVERSTNVPSSVIQRELARVVEAVRERIRTGDPWLYDHMTERWARCRQDDVLAGGRLGLGLDAFEELDAADRAAITSIVGRPDLIALAEGSIRATIDERVQEALQFAATLPTATDLPVESNAWKQARFDVTAGRPWRVGWDAAEQFRERTGLSITPLGAEVGAWLAAQLGWPIDKQSRTLAAPRGIDMVTVHPRKRMPIAVTSAHRSEAKRFRIAKALYYALGSEESVVVDSARLARHSEANAFAAELLAPAAYIRSHTPPGGSWAIEDVENVAASCAVDPRVIEHQIENRKLGVIEA
ncbi:MAG TPA: hypothetical protein VGM88_21560 [Kofleriaceae bacterium]|jgi:hypothetical protein